jgi:hypothetical protein
MKSPTNDSSTHTEEIRLLQERDRQLLMSQTGVIEEETIIVSAKKKIVRDDSFQIPTKVRTSDALLLENDSSTASQSELSSDVISDSDIEQGMTREHMKAIRDKQVLKVFTLLFLNMAIARTDQGIVPALATTLKSTFNYSDTDIGQLGSLVYIGAVIGKEALSLRPLPSLIIL